MHKNDDTIVAVSTAHGVGGIAVLRLSGPQAMPLALRHLSIPSLRPRHSHFAQFLLPDGTLLDEVLAVYFPAPHSYTGEDVVELSCHGSLYLQQAIVEAFIASGARLAEPGEFTLRAFLNHRLNLSQAEAVADLIDAVSLAQHRLAISQLRGGYAQELESLRAQLLDLTTLLELELDFSQEDVEFADRRQLIALVDHISDRVNFLRHSFRMGNAIKRGIPVAILGQPNAGKSTLLNALLHDDRAIVSPIPGTTRDTIEETILIDGIPFRIIDTAGLRNSPDPLEAQGVQRSLAAATAADIIILLHDASTPDAAPVSDPALQQFLSSQEGKHILHVYNKIDLPTATLPTAPTAISISAKQGTSLHLLTEALANIARDYQQHMPDLLLTNARHLQALDAIAAAIQNVSSGLTTKLPADLVAVDLRDALYHLGSITGQVSNNELLQNIFSRFCIGK